MELSSLFEAVDAKPFRPFIIEIISGRQVKVSHPDNILIIPSRQNVKMIQVYYSEPFQWSLIYPEGIAALHMGEEDGNGHEGAGR